jgi:hypothetical protein
MGAVRALFLFAIIFVGLAVTSASVLGFGALGLGVALAFGLVGLFAAAVASSLLTEVRRVDRIEQRLAAVERRGQEGGQP